MADIVVINSAAAREDSISCIVVDDVVTRLTEGGADALVDHRDLGADPVPHLTIENFACVRGVAQIGLNLATRPLL